MKVFKKFCMLLTATVCGMLGSCRDYDDNIGPIMFLEGYEFAVSDSVVAANANTFVLSLDTCCDYLPKDWDITELGFDEQLGFRPVRADDRFFYASIDDNMKMPNGIKCGWLKVEKIMDGNRPALKIGVDENDSDRVRSAEIKISRKCDERTYYGSVIVSQHPKYDHTPFEMKVRYKGKVRSSMAHIDDDGKIVMEDVGFKEFMENLESRDGIEAVVMDDEIIDYFDDSDVAVKPALAALRTAIDESMSVNVRADLGTTRGKDAFRYMADYAAGYFAVFDDTGFSDTNMYRNLSDFMESFDNGYLRGNGLNDKISSLAVAYKGTDKDVCAVLTVWEDSYYNNGDDNRTKHRLSFVASYYTPMVSRDNLKRIKCINSSNSWNDRISSLSFHFGHYNTNLKDY